MKKWLFVGLAAMMAAGCGNKGGNAPSSSGGNAPAGGGMKIGLILPGPAGDHGWNGLAHDAGVKLHTDTGADVHEVQVTSSSQHEAQLRQFAAEGYPLVIAHGEEFGKVALKVGKDFPKTYFVVTSGSVSAPNVTSLNYTLEEATYVLGLIAAGVSHTNKMACLGGMQLPTIQRTFDGLIQGAKAVKPGIVVTSAYVGNWEDTGAAKQQTATLISQGADVVFHNADAAGLGMFQAVQEANKAGKTVYALGSNADQTAVAPDVCLASAVMELSKTFGAVADEVKAGKFNGTVRHLGMKEGYLSVAINPALQSKIPPAVMKQVQTAEAAIKAGTLKVAQKP